MEVLRLELQDMVIIGKHGDFGRAVDPLEDKVEKVMIGVDSGAMELTCVDLDGDLEITNIYQIQDNTNEEEVRNFVEDNIQEVIEAVRNRIADLISG